jgi:putative membrane protein
MVRLAVNWILLGAAFAVLAWIFPDVEVRGGIWGLLVIAAVFGLVNLLVGPLLRLLSLPLTVLTLGLFSLVVNGILLALTAGLTDYLDVGGFLQTVLAAVVLSILNAVLRFAVVLVTPGTADRA